MTFGSLRLVAGLAVVGLTALPMSAPVQAAPEPAGSTSTAAAPAAPTSTGPVRTFDREPLGQPPQGCAVRGDVTVAEADFGGDPGNQALRLLDDSASSIAEVTCDYPSSAEKSVTFGLAPQRYGNSFLFGVRGRTAAGGAATAWWFELMPVAATGDARLRVYDGSAWRRLGHVPGFTGDDPFTHVKLTATADAAEVTVGGHTYFTDTRRSATVDLDDVVFSSAGTAARSMEFHVDNVKVASTVNRPPEDPRTVVAVEPAGRAPRFPDIIRLDDGRLMVAYYSGTSHTDPNAHIKMTTSDDNGRTWSSPRTIVDGPYDDRDPKVTQLADGTIVLSYFITNWHDPCCAQRSQLGTHVVRSTDGGQTWSEPIWVNTTLSCSQPPPAGGCPPGTALSASHGSLVELANGDVLAPLYGRRPGDATERAVAARSTDGGRTWDIDSESTIASGGSFSFQEPNLTVLPSGEIVAGIRTTSTPQRIYVSRSFDNGRTWTPAEPTDIPGSSHHQLLREDGSLLLTYGDVSAGVAGRPTSGTLIPDAAGDWSGHGAIPIYDSGSGDQANPSSIELEPGEFMTLGYDVPGGTLYGVRTELSDYIDP